MKKIVSVFILGFAVFAKAESLNCQMTEFYEGQQTVSSLNVESVDDPHGGMTQFRGQHFEDVTGFVSLLKKEDQAYAVISFYSDKLSVNSSGQFQLIANGQYSQHQVILPSPGLQLAGFEIVCIYNK